LELRQYIPDFRKIDRKKMNVERYSAVS